jgi:hypothetical protein
MGKNHKDVDCLSRNEFESVQVLVNEGNGMLFQGSGNVSQGYCIMSITDELKTYPKYLEFIIDENLSEFATKQFEDVNLHKLFLKTLKRGNLVMRKVKDGNEEKMVPEAIVFKENPWDSFVIKADGRLYHRLRRYKDGKIERICVPKLEISNVLKECHCKGHFGFKRTYARVQDQFFWLGMSKDVQEYCKSCLICQKRGYKAEEKNGLMKIRDVSRRFEMIGMDIYSGIPMDKEGYKYVLVITAHLTKWATTVPMRTKTATEVAEATFENWITKFGAPEAILTDGGGEFLGELAQKIYEIMKIKKFTTSPYHPQCNGMVERFNRTMGNLISK